MYLFKDNDARAWTVKITVATVKKIRAQMNGLDITKIPEIENGKMELLNRLTDDVVFLVDLLYLICEDQVRERDMTPEQFGASLAGDSIEDATAALLDELIDFFPGAKRKALRKMVDATKKSMQKIKAEVEMILENPEELEKAAEASLRSHMKLPGKSE